MNSGNIQEYTDRIKDYINNPSQGIFSDGLLNEFKEFGYSAIASKALRIHVKCLQHKHYELARRIEIKYGKYFPKHDIVVASGWSLTASQKKVI